MSDRLGSPPVRTRWSSMAAALFVAPLALGCMTTGPPKPESAYKAQIQVRVAEPSTDELSVMDFSESYSHGKRRRETRLDGQRFIWIDRPDLRITWILNPEEQSYEELSIWSPEAALDSAPNPFGSRSGAAFEPLGSDEIMGAAAQKYAVEGKTLSGVAWLSPDRIPIRFAGIFRDRDGPVEVEIVYTEVHRGGQPAYLFSIPPFYANYEKRKQRNRTNAPNQAIDDAVRRLEQEQRGRSGTPGF